MKAKTFLKHAAGVVAGAAVAGAVATAVVPKPTAVSQCDVTIEVRNNGVKYSNTVHKTLVAPGIRHLAALISGDSSSHYDTAAFICLGNDTTNTDTSMTALLGDTLSWGNIDSMSYAANYIRWNKTFLGSAVRQTLREVGIFSDSAKHLLDRANVSWGILDTTDTAKITVQLRFR